MRPDMIIAGTEIDVIDMDDSVFGGSSRSQLMYWE
jgi:hypothetical protein